MHKSFFEVQSVHKTLHQSSQNIDLRIRAVVVFMEEIPRQLIIHN